MKVGVLASVGLLAMACSQTSVSSPPNPRVVLVFATWVADSNVSSGPELSYKPALTGLTSGQLQSATPAIDQSGTSWVIDLKFTAAGSALFATLTADNVAACTGDPNVDPAANCAQRHLSEWVGLSQTDIDSWDNAAYVAAVSSPYDLACVEKASPGKICPKFVSDPITLMAITGGEVQIAGSFTQQSATTFASAITSSHN